MPSRRDQVRKSDSRKSVKSEQDQSDQEEQPQKPQKGSGKQKNQQQQRGNDKGRADGQEDDPCGRQQQQQQQQGTGQKQQGQGQQSARGQYQQEETVNELNSCVKCGEEVTAGQVITLNGRKWHPECFTCGGCCMILAKVSFFLDGERIYCPSCWARNVKSNCSRCDGEITPEAMVVNFGIRRFHKACFICSRCRCDLAGLQFCIKGNQFTCQQCM